MIQISGISKRIFPSKIPAGSNYILVLTVFIIAALGFFFSERITIGDGFGCDGQFSARMAKDFYNQLVNIGVNDYRIQRILPCAIIHYSLRLLSIPLTDYSIIRAFGAYNSILLILIAYVWCLIAEELRISTRGKWLGFVGLFINFAVLKWAFYNPSLTDISGYAIGITMLLFFLKNRFISLYITMLIGAFTWPMAIYMGTALLLFPKDDVEPAPVRFKLNTFLALTGTAVILACIEYVLFRGYVFKYGVNKPILSVINLSIAVSLAYVFAVIRNILNNGNFFNPGFYVKNINIIRQLGVILTFFAVKTVIYYGSNEHVGFTIPKAIGKTVLISVMQPGIFFISHVIFYGPVVILCIFLWKPVCRLIQNNGIGLTLCVLLSMILAINSESRVLINSYPLLLPFIIKATDSLKWKKSYYWLIAVLAFLLSKVWMTINVQPLSLENIGPPYAEFREFPFQYYFMSHGPWMSHWMYVVQGAFVLLSGIIIYFVIFHREGNKSDGVTG